MGESVEEIAWVRARAWKGAREQERVEEGESLRERAWKSVCERESVGESVG